MKHLLSFLLILLAVQAMAARVLYIAPTGNDANTSTQAQSQSTPWKTLGSHTGSLASGDTVKYQCNGTYFDSVAVTAGNVTLTSYGTGAQPNLTGFYTITTWTSLGGGIYESEVIPTNIGCGMVAINNKSYAMGRYPNAGTSNDGYLVWESHSGTTSITDNSKPAAIDATYIGAQLCMRVAHYEIARANITGVSGNTITFSGFAASGGGSLSDNFGYFVQNSKNTLDQFGEWYYNPSTKKLDVYFGSAGPTGNTVKVATRDKIIIPHASNLTLSNLTISGANFCIAGDWAESNLTVKNCNLQFANYGHMSLAGMKNTVRCSTIR
jgi:hypothetical protein